MANNRNFCVKNKTNLTNKLRRANRNHLFSLHDADSAFNHFIKKLKLKLNKSFPFELVNSTIKKSPWMTPGILKSIKTKNKLYNKTIDIDSIGNLEWIRMNLKLPKH